MRGSLRAGSRTKPGSYRLLICADDSRKVHERNERNNCRVAKGVVTVRGTTAPATTPATQPAPTTTTVTPPSPGDTKAPETTITAAPDAVTAETGASFAFTSSETDSTFACRFDDGPETACASPRDLTDVTVGEHVFTVRAIDGAGNQDPTPATASWRVEPAPPIPPGASADSPPPAPETLAPQPGLGQVTDLADAVSFWYQGQDAGQFDVANGAIDEARIAIIRGRARNRMGAAVAGARVTVLGHPELGRTATRADGRFDLVVNGGGPLTVTIERAGYLPVQRTVEPTWRGWTVLDDVVLIPLDVEATTVDGEAAGIQVVRGSRTTDGDGARQPTLLFEPGTAAQMQLPDGSAAPLSDLTVRATEYTVGPTGVAAMPGSLPPTSAYTHAVEYTVDEAIAAGARRVTFDRPVIAYHENFIGFPVGADVPVASYDRERGAWVPEPDGRVIKVLSEAGGVASVDVTGDGVADDGGSLGLDQAEKERLAALYDAGDTLWRVPVSHFSPWDHNWPYGPPPGATGPPAGGPPPPPCSSSAPGSTIGCEEQTLGEDLTLAGLQGGLHYRSNRVPPTAAPHRLRLQLIPGSVPAGVTRVILDVFIAGRHTHREFAPAAGLADTITWDGRNAFGQVLQGTQPVLYRVGYVYDGVYHASAASFDAAFGAPSGVAYSALETRQEVVLSREFRTFIGGLDPRGAGLGGWTLGIHHSYDPTRRTLVRGDGASRAATGLADEARIIAGIGLTGSAGDGGQATAARLASPQSVAVAPDGTVAISDTGANRIRRIARDGVITTIAGTGTSGGAGDGGPATSALLSSPRGVTYGADGRLYIADTGNDRVRRIAADGTISTVAGGGVSTEDGVPATQAVLVDPTDVAVAADGTMYIVGGGRVRRVGPDGRIAVVAGGGGSTPTPAGILATQATLTSINGTALAPDGSLLLAVGGGARIVRLGTDGILRTVAGGGGTQTEGNGLLATQLQLFDVQDVAPAQDGGFVFTERSRNVVRYVSAEGRILTIAGVYAAPIGFNGDGRAATDTRLSWPFGVALDQDGRVLFTESQTDRRYVRAVSASLPGFVSGHIRVPSEDGREVYRFTAGGRHVDTRDALTGATLWTFGYDPSGRLATVTDAAGLTTTIERAQDGRATAIIAPGGQRTGLTINADGLLSAVTDPTGRAHAMTYADGLLERFERPGGAASTLAYDEDRRLVSDTDPAGGTQTLARTDLPDGWQVTRTTPTGRVTTYRVERLDDGTLRRTITLPGGAQSRSDTASDGSIGTTFPDGSTTAVTAAPDGRFGLMAPSTTTTTTTPGGRVRTVARSRTAVLADPSDPFSATTITEDVVTNGRLRRSVYDAATRTLTDTTAAGRVATTRFDPAGRVIGRRPAADAIEETFTYDQRGRLETTNLGTQSLTFAYDVRDRANAITDATGAATAYEHDDADRVTRQTSPAQRATSFAYDTPGHLASITTPGNVLTDVDVDALGRFALVRPAGHTGGHAAAFDLDGQIQNATRPSGATVTSTYDGAGRRSKLAGTGDTTTLTYAGVTSRPQTATRTRGASASGLTFTYDGPLVTGVEATGPSAGTFAHTYDNDLREASRTLDVGGLTAATWAFTYDADGAPTGIGTFAVTRAGPGRLPSQASDGTGVFALEHDAELRATGRALAVNGTPIHSYTVTHDAAGRISGRSETVLGLSHAYIYGYDEDGQLVTVTRDGTLVEQYAYDDRGNRTSRRLGADPAQPATYDQADRITLSGTTPHVVDDDGFLTSRGTDTFAHGVRGELIQATVGGAVITYDHDALGRRVARHEGTATTQYLYGDPQAPFQVTASVAAGGGVTTYTYDEDGHLMSLDSGGVRHYVATDHLGSPLVVTTAAGAAVKVIARDAFGRVVSDSAPAFELPVGFAGGLADPDTGLVRFGLRDYDPATGRWTSRDPKLLAGGDVNLYRYAHNDPVGRVDEDGLEDVRKVPTNRPDGSPYALERYAAPSLDCKKPSESGEFFACQIGLLDRGMQQGGPGSYKDKFESGEAGFMAGTVLKEIAERIIDACRAPQPSSSPPTPVDDRVRKAFDASQGGKLGPKGPSISRGP